MVVPPWTSIWGYDSGYLMRVKFSRYIIPSDCRCNGVVRLLINDCIVLIWSYDRFHNVTNLMMNQFFAPVLPSSLEVHTPRSTCWNSPSRARYIHGYRLKRTSNIVLPHWNPRSFRGSITGSLCSTFPQQSMTSSLLLLVTAKLPSDVPLFRSLKTSCTLVRATISRSLLSLQLVRSITLLSNLLVTMPEFHWAHNVLTNGDSPAMFCQDGLVPCSF